MATLLAPKGISCHAWNADRTQVALCPNNNQVLIYKYAGGKFDLLHTLTEHDHLVTCIDWAPKTNRLLTCSQDRNAYVWKQVDNVWKPTLVLLRINRAAVYCAWSPQENKFAVTSGAKSLSICYFEEENDWWVSKTVKKHKSTVLAVAWHPNNVMVATASSDFRCRLLSAFIKGVDKKDGSPVTNAGEVLHEYDVKGWVHHVIFSPSGSVLAFCGHDSTVHIVSMDDQSETVIKLSKLPLTTLLFLSDTTLIGAGHDYNPVLIANDGGWKFKDFIDKKKAATKAASGGVAAAFQKFQTQARTGTSDGDKTTLSTKHMGLITCLRPFAEYSNGTCKKFTSTGGDGRIVVWDTDDLLDQAMANLKI